MALGFVIPLFFLFLLLEGFFSGSEIAVVSCDKTRLRHAYTSGSKLASFAQRLISHPEFLFSTTLLGTNLFVVANTILITLSIHHHFGSEYSFFTLLLSPVILILGEIVPKSLFQKHADTLVMRIALPLYIFSILFYPLVTFLSKLTKLLLRKVATEDEESPSLSREELKDLLNLEKTKMLAWERRLLFHLFNFSETPVRDIMTPINQVFALRSDLKLSQVLPEIATESYSRIPVYDKKAYNITGVIDSYDLLFCNPDTFTKDLMKTPLYIPETMPAGTLLSLFQKGHLNMAIVVDEFGATVGVVTLEDVTEEIVGEIEDEYDETLPLIQKIGPQQYAVSGLARLKEIEEQIHIKLPEGNYETLNGFLQTFYQKIPQNGDILKFGGLTFMIRRATPRAVQEVLIELSDE